MIWFAFLVSLVMGMGSLAWSYAQAGQELLALLLLFFGGTWLYAGWKGWNWFSTAGIFLSLGLAAYGLWVDLPTGWMLAGALGGLMAWDLADFIRRLRFASASESTAGLQARHLARLTIVAVLGHACAAGIFIRVGCAADPGRHAGGITADRLVPQRKRVILRRPGRESR